jgi:hypothetical protein
VGGGGDPAGALVDLAVHAWMEGHLAGEDTCPGCAGDCGWPRGAGRVPAVARACAGSHSGATVLPAPPGPSGPFPRSDDPVLIGLVEGAAGLLREGRPAAQVVPMLAARAWAEGHVEGEDRCPGCDWRGGLPRGADREALLRARLEGASG